MLRHPQTKTQQEWYIRQKQIAVTKAELDVVNRDSCAGAGAGTPARPAVGTPQRYDGYWQALPCTTSHTTSSKAEAATERFETPGTGKETKPKPWLRPLEAMGTPARGARNGATRKGTGAQGRHSAQRGFQGATSLNLRQPRMTGTLSSSGGSFTTGTR